MTIYIHGGQPNAAIILTAETQAERDQIERLKKEAAMSHAILLGASYDVAHTLRLRIETKP